MVSFNEMHGLYIYEFKVTSSSTICCCITADRTLPSPFTSFVGGSVEVNFIFVIIIGYKEKSKHFFSSKAWKRVPNCVKSH
jgi:hypothetical protein